LKLPLFKLMLGMLAQPANMMKLAHMSTAFDKIRCATENGDLKYGVHLTGQVQGIINDMPTVKEVIDRTVKEALEVYARMGTMLK